MTGPVGDRLGGGGRAVWRPRLLQGQPTAGALGEGEGLPAASAEHQPGSRGAWGRGAAGGQGPEAVVPQGMKSWAGRAD